MSPAANAWPPKEIWAAVSSDGLSFSVPGIAEQQQPVLRPADIDADAPSLKALRLAYDARQQKVYAMANTWDRERRGYRLWWAEGALDLSVFDQAPKIREKRTKRPRNWPKAGLQDVKWSYIPSLFMGWPAMISPIYHARTSYRIVLNKFPQPIGAIHGYHCALRQDRTRYFH